MMFLLLTVTIDSSERQTTGFPLPTSTVNHATSSISTSGIVEQLSIIHAKCLCAKVKNWGGGLGLGLGLGSAAFGYSITQYRV